MTTVRTIAVFLKWNEDARTYDRVDEPAWNVASNGGEYIAFHSRAERVAGVVKPSGDHFLFADTEEDKEFLATLQVGEKVEVRER